MGGAIVMPEIAFIALAIITGFARGIHEGMVMVMPFDVLSVSADTPGVRKHRWFNQYHVVSLCRSITAVGLGALLCAWWQSLLLLPLVGTLFLLWEATEIGYSLARSGKMMQAVHDSPHEHIDFADIASLDVAATIVYLLHAGRVAIGVTLIIMGGLP